MPSTCALHDGQGQQAAASELEQSAFQKTHLSQHTGASGVTRPRFFVFLQSEEMEPLCVLSKLHHRPVAQALCYFNLLKTECFVYTYVSAPHACLVPLEVKRRGQEPLELGLRELQAMRMLGTKSGSSTSDPSGKPSLPMLPRVSLNLLSQPGLTVLHRHTGLSFPDGHLSASAGCSSLRLPMDLPHGPAPGCSIVLSVL